MPEAKLMVVSELEETKRSYFMADPAQLLVVGVDFGGVGDVGYDQRIELPLDPQLLESIKERGVIKPVHVRTDGERKVVVDGRRRVLHARAVNMKLQAENPGIEAKNLVRVPYIMVRGDEMSLFTIQEISNAYAVTDPPYMQAKKIQFALDRGMSELEVCKTFGISGPTLQDRIKLLNLAPEAAKALVREEMSANAALEMSAIPMAEQLKVLARAREDAIATGRKEGRLSTKTITNAVADTRAAGNTTTPKRQTPSDVVKAIDRIMADLQVGVAKSGAPFGKDGRTANLPELAAMGAALRRIAKLVHKEGKTWDAEIKALVKSLTDDQAELETETPKARAKVVAKE